MEIKINLDLPGIIAQACSNERLQPLIDKAISDAPKSAIQEATGYRSPFSEALKAQLSEVLPHGLHASDAVKFQHILNEQLTSLVNGANCATVATAIEQATRNVMPDVPTSIKVSELLELAREGFCIGDGEAFYAYFEPSKHGGGGILYFESDETPGYGRSAKDRESRKYDAEHRLAFDEHGNVYAMRFKGEDLTPASRPTVINKLQSTLMAMYVGRTRLELDMDDDDVRHAAAEQHD